MMANTTQTMLKGEVIHGRQIGRTIGFPTANLYFSPNDEPYLPKGVYGVKVQHQNAYYNGVMNVGKRPTFKEDDQSISCEVHILDFNQDIYGEHLSIDVLFFIREEQAFHSIDQLVQQLHRDIEQTNRFFDAH